MKKAIFYIVITSIIGLISGCDLVPNTLVLDSPALLVEDAKRRVMEVEVTDFKTMIDREEYFILIDVRTENEHDVGYIPGSVLIPRGLVEFRIANENFWEDEGMYVPEKTDLLIIYCKSGNRSALAADALRSMGYKNILSLMGGWKAWKATYPENIEKNAAPSFIAPSDTEEEKDDSSC